MRIDLHLHTSVSDGSLAPADLARAAHAAGLSVIAITDHDTVAGVEEARAAAPPGLTVVAGVELSCGHGDEEIHILGYFIDPRDPALVELGARAVEWRRERVERILEKLRGLGVELALGEVLEAAGEGRGVLGRPHVARALVRAGHVTDVSEAFERYLARGRPAFVPTQRLSLAEAVRLIHGAGGLAVWAHPPLGLARSWAAAFAALGVDGIECYRPPASALERSALEALARRHGLLRSGGSDWHGAWNGLLGSFAVGPAKVGALLARGGIVVR